MQNNIIERIRKLLRLAESDNPHEAALAGTRAAEMLERYNLDLSIVEGAADAPDTNVDLEFIVLAKGAGSVRWQGLVADGIARTAYCMVYYAGGMRTGKLAVVGTTTNRAALVELHTWLCAEIERLSRRQNFRSVSQRSAYCLGAASTIRERLIAEHWARQAAAEESRALVVRHQQANKDFMEAHGIHLAKSRRSKLRHYGAYDSGRQAGRDISLTPRRNLGANTLRITSD